MKKKKIIFYSYNLDIGGIERAILNYIKYIDKSKYDITLMLFKKEGIYLDEVPKDVKVIGFNVCESKNVLIRKMVNFFKLLYFSIKYYHKFYFSASFTTTLNSGSILSRKFSKNNAIWFHGNYWDNKEEGEKFLKRYQVKKFKKIVFVSNKSKEKYLDMVPDTKQDLYVINNLINIEEIAEKSKEKVNVIKRKTTLLNVGRHEEAQKQLHRLFQACKRLLNEGYDFDLWLVGDGPDKKEYEHYVKKLNIEDNVSFWGKQNNVFPYYKLCDAVVLSSNTEGNPVVFLEAKVMHKPIITTNVSDAMTEIGEDYGIVTNIDDEDYYLGLKTFLDKGFKIKKNFDPYEYNKNQLKELYKVIEK